ncbi:hypothetical protein BH11PAT4_BH11PAT4_0160 [soil metagenome]
MEPKKTFYVAALAANIVVTGEVVRMLEARGMVPTLDWTKAQEGIHQPYTENMEANKPWADAFAQACADADVLVLLHYKTEGMRGAYIETGIAVGAMLMAAKLGFPKPKQIIWATNHDHDKQSLFMCLSSVTLFNGTPEEFLAKLPSLLA